MTTFVITLGLTYLTSISPVLEFLIALVGLGVAIDYSLRVVTRWREERARGRDNTSAVIAAMSTAGRASGVLTPVEVLVRPAAAGQPSSGWRRCRVSRPSPRRRRARQ